MKLFRLSTLTFRLIFCLLTPVSLLLSCTPKDPKFDQYYIEGEQLYLKSCANCHQKDGTGLGLVYPPLAPSDYMDTNFNNVICLIKNGGKEEIIVNGKSFHQPMPGVPSLTELEIAEITTYIYNNWGHTKGLIQVKQVHESLQSCVPK